MSAAVINFSDLNGLTIKTLVALAKAAAFDIDQGADKRAVLERIMRALASKVCP